MTRTSYSLLFGLLAVLILLSEQFAESRLNVLEEEEGLVFPGNTNNEKKRKLNRPVKGDNKKNDKKQRKLNWNRNTETSETSGDSCCVEDSLGTIWGATILGISRNPSLKDEIINTAIAGSAAVLAGRDVDKVDDYYTDYLLEFGLISGGGPILPVLSTATSQQVKEEEP